MTEVNDEAFDAIKADNIRLEKGAKVTGKDIAFVIDTICKEAKYDRPSILQLFYGMATAFTRLGMGHKVNSRDSGSGKSYLTNKVAGYFPKKYVLNLGGASNKAFQHKQGDMVIKNEITGELEDVEPMIEELERKRDDCKKANPPNEERIKEIERRIKYIYKHQQKLVDLDNTIILVQDTPQEGLLANLMSLVSQDSDSDQEYLFVNDKLQGTSNIIHGMPVIFYTRVIDDSRNVRAEELFRRFINVTPNATKEKVQEANRVTFKRFGLLPEEYDEQVVSREDKIRAREIVANLVEKLILHTEYLQPKESGVRIPFESALGFSMPCNSVFEMTVSDRTARYLSIITKVNMDNRSRFVHKETGAFYPISTFDDLKETFTLMEMGGSNIRPYLVVMYNEVIFPLYSRLDEPRTDKDENGNVLAKETYKGLRVQEIIDGAKNKLHFTISAKEMYSKYLTPMVELGLINWAKSVLKGSEKLYYPADPDSSKVHSLFPDSDDLRLVVTDKAFYPREEVIEQCYGSQSKLSSDLAQKNILDVYRLEDHLGNEITISELINRNLSNPELCFKAGWDELEYHDIRFDKDITPNVNTTYAHQIMANHLHNV